MSEADRTCFNSLARMSRYSPSRVAQKPLSADDRPSDKERSSLDDRIREILGDTPEQINMETENVGSHSRKRNILSELPSALSGIADTPRKRPMHKDNEKLEKATFNTARDSLMWYRHASEMVFSGTCRANQTDICAALKKKIRLPERHRKSAPRSCRRESTKHALNGRLLPFHGSGSRTGDRRRSQSAARNP